MPSHEAPASRAWTLGLLLAPAITAAGALIYPLLSVAEGPAVALTFAGGAGACLVALAVAARAATTIRAAVALGAGGIALVAAAHLGALRAAIALMMVNLGLAAVAHATGGSIGRRVAHPGHLLPACAVAAAADLVSVIHPAGPSHAIAASARALSFFAVGFPVPDTQDVAPALGVGDLVFIALVLGVAATHRISLARVAAAAALGLAVAGALAAAFEAAIPALVPLGAAVVTLVPEARSLRREDRRTATLAVGIAAAIVVGVLISPR